MISCDTCGKECANDKGLKIHKKACKSGENNFNCKYCNKQLCSQYMLNRHLQEKTCEEHKRFLKEQEENKYKHLEDTLEQYKQQLEYVQEEYKTKTFEYKRQIEILQEKNKQIEDNYKTQTTELETKNEQQRKIITYLEQGISKFDKVNGRILSTTNSLINKVGYTNNISQTIINNNLPILTNDIIGDSIRSIKITKNIDTENYYEQLHKGLKHYVFKTDKNRNHLIYNYDGTYIKDNKGQKLSEIIATHPETNIKKDELRKQLQDIQIQIEYDQLSQDELIQRGTIIQSTKQILQSTEQLIAIQKTLIKRFYPVEQSNDFILFKFLEVFVEQVKSDPSDFLFVSPVTYIINNKYTINPNKLLVKDDNNNEHKLTDKDMLYMINHVFNHAVTITNPLSEQEITAIKNSGSTFNKLEDSLFYLQLNIKRYNTIIENTIQSKKEIEQILQSIENYNED